MQVIIMLSIFFNGLGQDVTDFLPSCSKFNGEFFIIILSKIEDVVYPLDLFTHSAKKYCTMKIHFVTSQKRWKVI